MSELETHKTYRIRKDVLFFVVLALIAILLGVLAPLFLPDRFYNDALTLTLDLYNEIGWRDSYPLTIGFYKYSGLRLLPYSLIAFIQLSILFWVLFRIGVPSGFSKPTLKNGLVWISFILLAIYVSMPSKEFLNFLVMALIPLVCFKKYQSDFRFILASCVLFLAFGAVYRAYYILIPVLSLLLYWVSTIRMQNRIIFMMSTGLFAVIALSLSYSFIKGEYFSELSRELVNSTRVYSAEANSMIDPPLTVDTWYGEAVSITYGFFSVNLPVNGLRFLLKPQILAFVIWQLLLFGVLIWGFANCLRNKKYYFRSLWIFFFVFSYFIIQGVFEPDLGSAIKHKMGFFPLIYSALYYDYFRKSIPV